MASYGRYWGCRAHHDCLHFEVCYYQPIEWALENGIRRFEGGAQGEHKLKRGFLPETCWSAHWLRHAGLHRAVAAWLENEGRAVSATTSILQEHSPFRDGVPPLPPRRRQVDMTEV